MQRSSVKSLSQSTIPNLLLVSQRSCSRCFSQQSDLRNASRRALSWGRKCYWSCFRALGTHASRRGHSPASRDERFNYAYPSWLGDKGRATHRYLSWWRSRDDTHFSKDPAKGEKHGELPWDDIARSYTEYMNRRLEKLKEKLDDDPYGMIFGYRLSGRLDPQDRKPNPGQAKPPPSPNANEKSEASKARQNQPDRVRDELFIKTSFKYPFKPGVSQPEVIIGANGEEFEFDPITMRKVAKQTSGAKPVMSCKATGTDGVVNIPVKKYVSTSVSCHDKKPSPAFASQKPKKCDKPIEDEDLGPSNGGLAQSQSPRQDPCINRGVTNAPMEVPAARQGENSTKQNPIETETTMDRHIENQKPLSPRYVLSSSFLKEDKREDVDLLRASDVRASSGLHGKPLKETALKQEERRKLLEAAHLTRIEDLDAQVKDEIQSQTKPKIGNQTIKPTERSSTPNSMAPSIETFTRSQPSEITPDAQGSTRSNISEISEEKPKIYQAKRATHKQETAKNMRDEQINTPRFRKISSAPLNSAINAREVFPEKSHDLGQSDMAGKLEKILARSYQHMQRAPRVDNPFGQTQHGRPPNHMPVNKEKKWFNGTSPLDLPNQESAEQLVDLKPREKLEDLLRRLVSQKASTESPNPDRRSAGSSKSGNLQPQDASKQNLQSAADKPSDPSDDSDLAVYRILAYDATTEKVFAGQITCSASLQCETRMSIFETFYRLAHPAKFLAHFNSLEYTGYDLIAGGTDILIFKRVRNDQPRMDFWNAPSTATRFPHINPIDGTTTQTGNFASPTGFVNHDSVLTPEMEERQSFPSPPDIGSPPLKDKVRREEPVFSGSPKKWRTSPDKGRKTGGGSKMKQQCRKTQRRRMLKRMFWAGMWVAGCCYVAGVAVEVFRDSFP